MSLVSVVVPAYNSEKYLRRTVETLLSQKHRDIEVILIDDGSTDSTFEIMKEISESDGRVRVAHVCNGGVSAARNLGISFAMGEWLMFVDSDDELEDSCVSSLLTVAVEKGADFAVCGMKFDYLDSRGELTRSEVYSSGKSYTLMSGISGDRDAFEHLYRSNYLQSSCAKLYSADFIRRNNLRFDSGLTSFEDYSFVLSCLKHAETIAVCSAPYYHYFHRKCESGSNAYRQDIDDQMEFVALTTEDFYQTVFDGRGDEDLRTHIVQFFTVAVNRIVGGTRGIDRRDRLDALLKRPVFKAAVNEAASFPNLYCRLLVKLAVRRNIRLIVVLALFRNAVRKRFSA